MSSKFERLKRFLLRETFDFDRPDISLHNFHKQLPYVLAINGVFFNKRNSKLRFILPFTGVGFMIVFLVLNIMATWHYANSMDYAVATECFCYVVILGCIITVYISVFANSTKIHTIVDKMDEDFNVICKLENRYRQPFLKGQLQIWQLCVVWFAIDVMLNSMYLMMPHIALIYQSLFVTQDENTVRPLQFPVWLPHDDAYRTPNYEMFLIIQTFFLVVFLQNFYVYVYVLFHILLHYCIILDMIPLDFEVIFDDLDENVALLARYDPRRIEVQHILNGRCGNIAKRHLSVLEWYGPVPVLTVASVSEAVSSCIMDRSYSAYGAYVHRAVKTVSSVYGFPLMYQVTFSSTLLCLVAYQVAKKLENGSIDFIFICLGCVMILQLWIPCYLGSLVRSKAIAVGDACWNCGWHQTSLGRLVRSDIIIIILRSQQPITIKYIGLPSVELQTFSLMTSKAYSYFNVLRQYT